MRLQDITAAFGAFRAAKNLDTVSEEEFLARLEICKGCPQNKRGVIRLRTRISKILGDHSNRLGVREEITKHSCGVCGCSFGLLLPAKKEHLHQDSEAEAAIRPEHCWVNKE